jgi:hypothetical protein
MKRSILAVGSVLDLALVVAPARVRRRCVRGDTLRTC